MAESVSIDRLELEIVTTAGGASRSLDTLIRRLNELDSALGNSNIERSIRQLATLQARLNGIAQTSNIGRINIQLRDMSTNLNTVGRASRSVSTHWIDNYLKLGLIVGVGRRVFDTIFDFVRLSNDYVENVNLFTVSMGRYAEEAAAYAEIVSDTMGIDPSEWMRTQGVFMTLATGFEIGAENAAKMSKNLTQLSYDIASFYNLDTQEAADKIRSAVSGEIEPARNLGFDLSQARLQQIAEANGIQKNVEAMTQAEKTQLRYIALMTQVTQVQGDMARTLESPANQLRVFNAQLTQAGRAIGNIFIPALNAILPYATAVLVVIRELADEVAALAGFELPEVDYSGVTGAEDLTEELENADDTATKLKRTLLGFDQLNILASPSGAAADTAANGTIDFGTLPEYDFLGGAVQTRIDEIKESMQEWLGVGGELNSWADLFDTKLGEIALTAAGTGAALAAIKLAPIVIDSFSALASAISGIGGGILSLVGVFAALNPVVLAVAGVVAVLAASLAAVYLTNEDVRESVNEAIKSLGESLGESFGPMIEWLSDTVVPGLKAAWDAFVEMLLPFGEWLEATFTFIWEDMLIPAIEFVADEVIPDFTTVFQRLWEDVLVPASQFLEAVLTPTISAVSDALTWLREKAVLPLASALGEVLGKAWNSLVEILNEAVMPAINALFDGLTWVWDHILSPLAGYIMDGFSPAIGIIGDTFTALVADLKDVLSDLIDFVAGVFTLDWSRAWDGVKNVFSGIWNALVGVLEGAINMIISGINMLIGRLNTVGFDLPDWLGGGHFGFNIKEIAEVKIPRFEYGGFPDHGEMFIARESGPEMVGRIGGRTAVANNDQIVEGISNGVYNAVSRAMSGGGGGNWTIQIIDTNGRVTGETIITAAQRKNRRDGRTTIPIGV